MKKELAGKLLRGTLRTIPVLAILYFLLRSIAANLEGIGRFSNQMRIPWMGTGILLTILYFVCQALIWHRILKKCGIGVGEGKVIRIFMMSLFGKYVPGKIWVATLRVLKLDGEGIRRGVVVGSIFIEHLYLLSSGLIYFILVWGFRGGSLALEARLPLIGLSLVGAALIVTRPHFLLDIGNLVLRHFGREVAPIRIGVRDSAAFFSFYTVTWMFLSLAIWMILSAVADVPAAHIPRIGAAFAVAFLGGFVALFAPGGLGVREGIFTLLLSTVYPAYLAAYFSLVLRLAFTTAELAGFALVSLIRLFGRRASAVGKPS